MRKSAVKRILCLLAAAGLVLTAGCAGHPGREKEAAGSQRADDGECPDYRESSGSGGNGVYGENSEDGESGSGNRMGRYAEEETDLTGELESVSGFKRLSDGRLIITDRFTGILESSDEGRTWKKMENSWLDEKLDHVYFVDLQMAPDGSIGAILNYYDETQEDSDEVSDFNPVCVLVRPDGAQVQVEIPLTEEDVYPNRIWISDRGRIFVTTLGDNIYEVGADGESGLFLTAEGRPELVQFQGDLMILDSYDFKVPLLYDMEKKEYTEDEGLSAFVEENYEDRDFNGGSWYDLYIFPGEEGALYLAGWRGLQRCRAGEESTEQLIDGNLSRLGSPRYSLKGMLRLENGEFLSVSGGGVLVRFTYDPEMPAVPGESLKVYSLEDSWDMRTAISIYQVNHPEVYVDYEIGLEKGGAITREDALKKLNTQIMAGQGPDLLMLDGLPMDSYMEKGLLLDLSDFAEGVNKEEPLYENFCQALAREGKIYTIPAKVYLPVMFGREKYVAGMKDLSSIAEGICRIREDHPGKDLIYLCEEKAVMKAFAPIAAPGWKRENGQMNLTAIGEFLSQMKKIYDAQMDGISKESLEDYGQREAFYAETFGEDWMYNILLYGEEYLYYVGDYLQLSVGVTASPQGFYGMTSAAKSQGFEDTLISPMEGDMGKVFVPAAMLAVSAASDKTERAENFLREFLGEEIQCALGGYVINRNALEENMSPDEEYLGENGAYGTVGITSEEGVETWLEIYVPSKEEMNMFRGWMETASIPYVADMTLERTVFEEGEKYMRGEQELEEALDGIRQRLAIYIAE